jgi:hypothetical protein
MADFTDPSKAPIAEPTKLWFVDKVLPGLVGGAITFLFLSVFGLFGVFIDRFTTAIGQSWLPPGTLILVAPETDCPDGGWDNLGAFLVGREKEKDGNFAPLFGKASEQKIEGWSYAKPEVCVKE